MAIRTVKSDVLRKAICSPCGASIDEQDAGQEGWIVYCGKYVCWYCQQDATKPLSVCLSITTYLNIPANSGPLGDD